MDMNEAPIQDLDFIDIVGNRKDGGIDLCIVISGFLDNSEEHEGLLRQKIQNYVNTVFSERWQQEHAGKSVTILLKATETPHQDIVDLISAIKDHLLGFNVNLRLENA